MRMGDWAGGKTAFRTNSQRKSGRKEVPSPCCTASIFVASVLTFNIRCAYGNKQSFVHDLDFHGLLRRTSIAVPRLFERRSPCLLGDTGGKRISSHDPLGKISCQRRGERYPTLGIEVHPVPLVDLYSIRSWINPHPTLPPL